MQKGAEKLVREYLNQKRLDIEDEDLGGAGLVTIHVTHRDESDIYDEAPGADILTMMSGVVRDLRQLSPLVYVTWDTCDEWVNLTITIRSTPRKSKPAEITNLIEKVIQGMPVEISDHPVVTGISKRYYRCEAEGVEVRTNIAGPVGNRTATLTWELTGDSVNGWILITKWGTHKATRPATFKKLTPKIILGELDRITAMLADPLNCLGHVINVKNDEGVFAMTGNRKHRLTFAAYAVMSEDERYIRGQHQGNNVLFINNLTGEQTWLRTGDEIPEHLKNIEI